MITLEFEDFTLLPCIHQTPRARACKTGLSYEMGGRFSYILEKLEETKPVIFCGDLNVAHTEIDLKNPKTNRENAGFTDEERQKFTELLNAGFVDTFRYFIRSRQVSTPGGLTDLVQEPRMQVGELTISVYPRV